MWKISLETMSNTQMFRKELLIMFQSRHQFEHVPRLSNGIINVHFAGYSAGNINTHHLKYLLDVRQRSRNASKISKVKTSIQVKKNGLLGQLTSALDSANVRLTLTHVLLPQTVERVKKFPLVDFHFVVT